MAAIASVLNSGFFQSITECSVSILNNYSSNNKPEELIKQPQVDPLQRVITLEEVSWHDSYDNCWIIIYDRVYDITDFFDEHPGGGDVLIEYAGRDASVAFRGSGHSKQAVRALDRFFIGELPLDERIFRKSGGYRLSDIPD